jgi:thymine-DNA glycosylase
MTRAKLSAVVEPSETESISDFAEEENPPPPQSSFNGALRKFKFGTATTRTLRSSTPVSSGQASRISKTTRKTARSTSSSPFKTRRKTSGYAAPSKYAHLSPLRDVIEPNLICVFIGANPGVQTAASGHAYAHPSNLFWKLLHSSGCTDRRCRPEEDGDLPRLYSMGNTNIVSRPTKDTAELSKEEMAAGTAILDEKMLKYKPEAVCIVGKGIWEAVWRYRHGRNPTKAEFHYGWQDEKENMGKSKTKEFDAQGNVWKGSKVFVATSTSGLAASLRPAEKEEIWLPFGQWVKQRREERAKQQPKDDLDSSN